MSLALVHSRARVGVSAPPVRVDVHLSGGLPGMSIVGLPDAAVRESKERVRAAFQCTQPELPARPDTVHPPPARLAPSDTTAPASAKTMVNRATLPPGADRVTADGEYAHSMTRPGYLARAASAEALVPQLGLDFEYRMGEYIGIANQQAQSPEDGLSEDFV